MRKTVAPPRQSVRLSDLMGMFGYRTRQGLWVAIGRGYVPKPSFYIGAVPHWWVEDVVAALSTTGPARRTRPPRPTRPAA